MLLSPFPRTYSDTTFSHPTRPPLLICTTFFPLFFTGSSSRASFHVNFAYCSRPLAKTTVRLHSVPHVDAQINFFTVIIIPYRHANYRHTKCITNPSKLKIARIFSPWRHHFSLSFFILIGLDFEPKPPPGFKSHVKVITRASGTGLDVSAFFDVSPVPSVSLPKPHIANLDPRLFSSFCFVLPKELTPRLQDRFCLWRPTSCTSISSPSPYQPVMSLPRFVPFCWVT